MTLETLLSVDDLRVTYRGAGKETRAVDGAFLDLRKGGLLGLVGESGCGKTTLARAIMGVLPRAANITGGRVVLDGVDLVALTPAERRARLWRDVAFIPQSAMNALDPVYRLATQMREVLCDRGGFSRAAANARAAELFKAVGLDPARLKDFPHQFSGGMRQRAAIAMALALNPKLIVADEPVTALDVLVQRQVLDTFRALSESLHVSAIIVTHDVSVVAFLCDTVAVMYAGRIVEHGPARDVLSKPAHPYTMGLMRAFPDLDGSPTTLVPIEGAPPSLLDPPPGCRFAPRCPFALPACRVDDPVSRNVAADHRAACLRADEAETLRGRAAEAATWTR
jgi:peptide/nickel transport system ATP-binding protein